MEHNLTEQAIKDIQIVLSWLKNGSEMTPYNSIQRIIEQNALLRGIVDEQSANAARYRWLRSQKSLTLQTEKQPNKWTRHDGSTFSASHYLASGHTVHRVDVSLDATIDAASQSATGGAA